LKFQDNQDGEHNSYTGSLNLSLDNYNKIIKWIISGDQIQEGSGFLEIIF
jgi:hypothetical protein